MKAQNECRKFGGQIAIGMKPTDRGQRNHNDDFGVSEYQVFLSDLDTVWFMVHTPDGMYLGPQWLGYRLNSKKILKMWLNCVNFWNQIALMIEATLI